MGWGSGSKLMSNVIDSVEETVLDTDQKIALFYKLIENFTDRDCDTLDECLGESKAFDRAYRMHWPDVDID